MTKNPNKLEIPGARNVGHLITAPPTDTPWLVENWIIEGELAVVHGAANTGKSYAVLDMGLHIAFDKKEWARNQIPHWRPVIYVPSEGIRGVERRIRTWLTIHETAYITEWDRWDFETQPVVHYDVDEDGNEVAIEYDKDPEAARPFYIYEGLRESGWPLLLNKSDESAATLEDLKVFIQWVAALWERLPVVIVDVVGDFTLGIDENDRDFGHALALMKPDKLGCAAVILVHHEGYQGGRVRGHSSVTGLVDASLGVESRDDTSVTSNAKTTWLRFYNDKQRNEERAEPMILILEKPDEELEAALITGRAEPERESLLLATFASGRRQGATAAAASGKVTNANDEAIMRAVQGGARRPKEIREATGLKVNTEQRRRKTLYERKLLANTDEGITITAEGEKALAKDTGWAAYGKATR